MLTEGDLEKIGDLLERRIDSAVSKAVAATVPQAVDAAVAAAVPRAVDAAVAAAVPRAVDAALAEALPREVRSAVDGAVPHAVDAAMAAGLPREVKKAVDAVVPNSVDAAVARSFGVYAEDFQHKLDLVVEGQRALGEQLERVEEELRQEIHKVDRRVMHVAADLAAHRADTEAHRGVYGVRES